MKLRPGTTETLIRASAPSPSLGGWLRTLAEIRTLPEAAR